MDKFRNIELVLVRADIAARRSHAFLELLQAKVSGEGLKGVLAMMALVVAQAGQKTGVSKLRERSAG